MKRPTARLAALLTLMVVGVRCGLVDLSDAAQNARDVRALGAAPEAGFRCQPGSQYVGTFLGAPYAVHVPSNWNKARTSHHHDHQSFHHDVASLGHWKLTHETWCCGLLLLRRRLLPACVGTHSGMAAQVLLVWAHGYTMTQPEANATALARTTLEASWRVHRWMTIGHALMSSRTRAARLVARMVMTMMTASDGSRACMLWR